MIERTTVGYLRLAQPTGRTFSPTERSLLQDAADRAALAIRRAQLHEEEHRIAVELQRGLIPKRLPDGERHRDRRLLRRRRARRASGRRLVRRVRDAGRTVGDRRRRRHRTGHPSGLRDGPAANPYARVRARAGRAPVPRRRADAVESPPARRRGRASVHDRLRDHRPRERQDLVGQRRSSATAPAPRRRDVRVTSRAATD